MSFTRRLCGRFGKFNLVGLAAAALQMALFVLLMKWRLPDVAAMPISVEIVLLHNFWWHERFTWRDRAPAGLRHRVNRLLRFHAANGLISIAGNTALTYCLVEQLNVPALPSAVAAIALCAPANFLLADQWIFKGSKAISYIGRASVEIRHEPESSNRTLVGRSKIH